MATVLISDQAIGHFLTNSLSAPTELFFYWERVQCGLAIGEALYGRVDQDGTLVDGAVTDWFQGLGVSNHAMDLTGATLQIDDESASPYYNCPRIKWTVGASVS